MAHSASHFANWVYNFRHPNKPTPLLGKDVEKRRALGTLDHQSIELVKERTFPKINKRIKNDEWSVFYADRPHKEKVFFSKFLNIGNQYLKGRPDLVFSHAGQEYFIIVERKITAVPSEIQHLHIFEPAQCQLWAYSWLDDFWRAKDVLLVLEIWERYRGGIRAADLVSWRRSNDTHHSHCMKLFEQYAARMYPNG